jgi:LemA protein
VEVAAVVAAVVVLAAATLLFGYNRLVRLRNRAEAAYADIDVQLRRRYDLIPNLVTTVRAYAEHERGVLEEVTAARADAIAAVGRARQARQEERITDGVKRLLAVAEDYPELRADARFRDLHDELVATENKLAFSRQLYNDTVQRYRDATQAFPYLLFAGAFGFDPPEFFAADRAERAPVQPRFDETREA